MLSKCGELLSFDECQGVKFRVGKSVVTHPARFIGEPDYLDELERQIKMLCEVKEVEVKQVEIPVFTTDKDLSYAGGFASKYYNNTTGIKIPRFNIENDTLVSMVASR